MCIFLLNILLECSLYLSMLHLSNQDFGMIFIEVYHVLEGVKSHEEIQKFLKGRELVQEFFLSDLPSTAV